MIDLSHKQHNWGPAPIFSIAGDKLIHMIVPPPGDIPWDLREIQDHRQLRADDLAHWRGLLLGIPHHESIKEETLSEIVQWVRQGGRLVMMGFEMGDRHHKANLNELAKEFGLRFNSDIVAPKGWTRASERALDIPVEFNIDSSHHPLLKGVRHLRLRNVCTLTIDPGSYVILNLGENGISWMKRENAEYHGGILRTRDAKFELFVGASWVPLVAEAPEGLTGAGRVLAIGTWDLLEGDCQLTKDSDNILFVRNLLNWLGGQAA